MLIFLAFPSSVDSCVFQLMVLIHAYCQPDGLIERFSFFLRTMRRSQVTVRAYMAVVRRYVEFSGHVPAGLDPVLKYMAMRRDKRLAQASLNAEVAALRCWFGWLKMVEPELWQPDRIPGMRKPPARVVRFLTDEEMGLLLAQPDLNTFTGFRDHVMMATLYQCGLRACELISMELGSIRLDGYLYVRGKGGHDRLVPFGGAWHGLMESYLRLRSTVRPGKKTALWLREDGRPLRNARSVWEVVNRHARKALGLACGYTRLERTRAGRPWRGHYPHLLRTSFATALYQRGVNLVAISQMLGHANVETTAHYLGVDLAKLREAIGHHPRARR